MRQVFKHFMSLTTTKLGIAFAFFIPLIFTFVWMTGYHNSTQRIDQLRIAIVNQGGSAGEAIQHQIVSSVPFHPETLDSVEEANKRMEQGHYELVAVIPRSFADDLQSGRAKLTFYINKGASEVASAAAEKVASAITERISKEKDVHSDFASIHAEVIMTHQAGDFAVTMVPLLLGFAPYIAMMTMNIHLRISSQTMKRMYGKWNIFWSRQLLLLLVSILASLFVCAAIRLFMEPAAPFWKMWAFEGCVFLSGICVTQMGLALFGHFAPFFNLLPIPLMIMTGGSIVPSSMLAPFYRHIGNFLPSGIRGLMQLIYVGQGIGSIALNLLLIALAAWGITALRTYMEKAAPDIAPSAAH